MRHEDIINTCVEHKHALIFAAEAIEVADAS